MLSIVVAFLYLQQPAAKLFHVPHVACFDPLPVLSLMGCAGMLAVLGGLLVLLGLFSRPSACIVKLEPTHRTARQRKQSSWEVCA